MNSSDFVERARFLFSKDDYMKALKLIEENVNGVQGNDLADVNILQGQILKALAKETKNPDVMFTYLLGSVECFSRISMGAMFTASLLFEIANLLGSQVYFKKSLGSAKVGLYEIESLGLGDFLITEKEELEKIIRTEKVSIHVPKTSLESSKTEETMSSDFDIIQRLRRHWAGLNVEIKRNFLKVITADLKSYVEVNYGKEEQKALEQVLKYARKNRKWILWICRSCSKRFPTADECKVHLEQEHDAEFKPCLAKDIPQRVSEVWASKISVGGWEPLDPVAAVGMIKNQLRDVKAFSYENGWSKDWPSVDDEERSKLLKEIKLLLVTFWELKILCCSIRDRVMQFVVKQLKVSKETLTDCRLLETPQGICLLECDKLNQVLAFLGKVKRERDDGTVLVCRAVDSFCGGTRYREKIDFDSQFSVLLLDKRLLQCKVARFDDEGTINLCDPNAHCTKSRVTGDYFVSWLTDYSSGVEEFRFPRPIREHNLGIWKAVMRALQFTCRTLRTKYAKKLKLLDYAAALTDAMKLCSTEGEYGSLLCYRCEEEEGGAANMIFLCAVRDVLKQSSYPEFDLEDCLNAIRKSQSLSDDLVLKSIEFLESEVNNKVALMDSKILLIEKSRISLLNYLTRLAVFDYRYYIHQPLREFLMSRPLMLPSIY